MVLERPGRLEPRPIDAPPTLDPHDVLVGVRAVGLCGTDHSIFTGAIPVEHPRVLGHEIMGEVIGGDRTLTAGTRVLVDPNLVCGRCARCLEERENICARARLVGRDCDGGLQERIALPRANLHPVPDGVPDHVVPAIQMLSTCLHGQRLARLDEGASVIVVGLGVTGLMHVQLASVRGAAPIVGITRSPRKREIAIATGADVVLDATDPDAIDRALEATGGGADVVIECAGTVATLGVAVRLARPGGQVVAYGTITEREGAFPFYDLYYKELDVLSPRAATSHDVVEALDAVASDRIDLEPLITHRIGFDDVASALRVGPEPDRLKTVVEVG